MNSNAISKDPAKMLPDIAHSLKTPINAIVGLTVLARRCNRIEEMRDYLRRIEDASYQLVGTINDVMDYIQLENENIYLESHEFILEDMIGSVLDLVQLKAEEKNIDLCLDFKSVYRQKVTADRYKIVKLIYSLLSNCILLSEAGSMVKLSIALPDTHTMDVQISSDSIGLSPEKIEVLFSGTAENGMDLALPICKKIVALMGGEIILSTESPRGTVCRFSIIVHAAEKSPSVRDQALRSQNLRILAADNRPDVLQYLKYLSGEIGAVFTSASTVASAMKSLVKSREFDFVFMNYEMVENTFGSIMETFAKHIPVDRIVLMTTEMRRAAVLKKTADMGFRIITTPVLPSAMFDFLSGIIGLKTNTSARHLFIPEWHGKKFLVIEDNEISREIIDGLLSETGASIDFAENGMIGVETYLSAPRKYDVILMDVQMPVMDSLSATRAIRASSAPDAESVPICAMTANTFDLDRKACYDAGMTGYISKPVTYRELINVIADNLKAE
jgi:CheY-like chemotaxis protein